MEKQKENINNFGKMEKKKKKYRSYWKNRQVKEIYNYKNEKQFTIQICLYI